MEAKLKSISRRIHWSLVLKAAVFALAWLWLPFPLFFLIALYLYFVPLFQSGKLAFPFFVLLVLAYVQTPTPFFAVVFGAALYVIFLIKDLLVIDRRSMYEFLVLALSFLLLRALYMRFNEGAQGMALWYAFIVAAAIVLLLRSLVRASGGTAPRDEPVALFLSFALLTQVIIVGLFLPLDFIAQSLLVFLVAFFLIDTIPEHLAGGVSRKKILVTAMVLFALVTIVVGSAQWGL